MNDLEAKLKLVEINTNDAQITHYHLYSSLLTFNGILLGAFALILTLNPKLPIFLLLCFLIPNLISISCIIVMLYYFRSISIARLFDVTNQITQEYPNLFQAFSSNFERVINKPKPQIKWTKKIDSKINEKFIFYFDKFIFIISLVNPIIFFIVLYNSQIH